jgi:hypothetical protein
LKSSYNFARDDSAKFLGNDLGYSTCYNRGDKVRIVTPIGNGDYEVISVTHGAIQTVAACQLGPMVEGITSFPIRGWCKSPDDTLGQFLHKWTKTKEPFKSPGKLGYAWNLNSGNYWQIHTHSANALFTLEELKGFFGDIKSVFKVGDSVVCNTLEPINAIALKADWAFTPGNAYTITRINLSAEVPFAVLNNSAKVALMYLELFKELPKKLKVGFKVGDRVEVLSNNPHGSYFKAGDRFTINSVGKGIVRGKLTGRDINGVTNRDVKLVIPELRRGDKVRISKDPNYTHWCSAMDLTVGYVGKVIDVDYRTAADKRVRVETLIDGKYSSWNYSLASVVLVPNSSFTDDEQKQFTHEILHREHPVMPEDVFYQPENHLDDDGFIDRIPKAIKYIRKVSDEGLIVPLDDN